MRKKLSDKEREAEEERLRNHRRVAEKLIAWHKERIAKAEEEISDEEVLAKVVKGIEETIKELEATL